MIFSTKIYHKIQKIGIFIEFCHFSKFSLLDGIEAIIMLDNSF